MSRLVMPRPAFFMHMPDAFFHYHAVLELLPPDAFEVIIPDDAPQALIDLVENSGYGVSYVGELLSSRTMYKYLISDHIFLSDYHLLSELGTRQVRFFCELGYDGLMLSNDNRFYDLFLCMGKYQRSKLRFCAPEHFHFVGWPQYDRWYAGIDIDIELLQNTFNCDRYRPVVLWQPTFGELSSIELYAPLIEKLSSRYNIVIKPHDYTLYEEPERMAQLMSLRGVQAVLTEPFDAVYLMVLADYVLADYGNTPFGAVYTDQQLLLLNVPNAYEHPFTGMGSVDINLRNYYPSLDPTDGVEDVVRILEMESPWSHNGVRLQRLRERLFLNFTGRAAMDSARFIAQLPQYL